MKRSKFEDRGNIRVVVDMADVNRWLLDLQRVPGFMQSDHLVQLCIDIASSVEDAPELEDLTDKSSAHNQSPNFPAPQLVQ